MAETQTILKEALGLAPLDRANLIDRLLASLDQPDEEIDSLWRKEIEARIAAYDSGNMETVSLEEAIQTYGKR